MMTYFWSESKVSLFQFLSVLISYFRLEFLSLYSIAHHLVLQCIFHLGLVKKTQDLFNSTAVYSAWRLGRPLMQLRPNDWTVLLEISPGTLA